MLKSLIIFALHRNFSFGKYKDGEPGIFIFQNLQLSLLDILIEKADAQKRLCKIFPKQAIISAYRQRI